MARYARRVLAVLSQLGPYLIDEELAEGGMARVFRARLRGLGGFEKTLVLKQIKPELAKDPRFVELFVREANTLVSMSHPHIVPVYELGAAEGTYYLSMEYVEGATVARMLAAGPKPSALPAALVAHIGAQLCDALDYAHGLGILHRDITPRNIIVDRAGHARLLDFGIAGALGVVDHEVFGSPGYMAPEQTQRKTLTTASDIFSLGAVLYEALTRRPAFEKTARGSLAQAPTFAASDDIPEGLSRVITSMLAREPSARPQSASEVARQLRGQLAQSHPEGVLAEMRAHVEKAARAERPQPAVEAFPQTAPLTARITETKALATSPILTEMLRSAPGVAAGSMAGQLPGVRALPRPPEPVVEGTRRIERGEQENVPDDETNAAATAKMMRAWPALAVLSLVLALGLAWLRPGRLPTETLGEAHGADISAPKTQPVVQEPRPAKPAPPPAPVEQVPPSEPRKPAVEAVGNANLSVRATPWGEVSIDGRSQGTTPLTNLKLRAGAHVIRVRCPPLARESELHVQVAADARARLSVDLSVDPPRTFLDGLSKVR
jgi:hypothetical protein